MATKQISGSGAAPDGSQYVCLTDGAGNLTSGAAGSSVFSAMTVQAATAADAFTNTQTGWAVSTSNGSTQELLTNGNYVFNGSTWDRQRTVPGATQSSGLGVTAAGLVPCGASQGAIASTATSVAASNIVLKASAGNLFSLCANAGASAGYLMVFDATSAPVDGAVTPIWSAPIAANGMFFTDFAYPIRCATGITLVFSTTGPFTKTASATAFLSGQFI